MGARKISAQGFPSPLPRNVFRGSDYAPVSHAANTWSLHSLSGRLVEISGHRASATLTVAFGLVLEAQRQKEPVVWVSLQQSTFFPPDVADSGVDLDALAVVRLPDTHSAMRATVQLTRSGGFGLVVLDLGPQQTTPQKRALRRVQSTSTLSTPLLTKLVGLAQKHDTAVVMLTEKTTPSTSVSPLISLRAEARKDESSPTKVEVLVLKDKRRGPGLHFHEDYRAPAGLC